MEGGRQKIRIESDCTDWGWSIPIKHGGIFDRNFANALPKSTQKITKFNLLVV